MSIPYRMPLLSFEQFAHRRYYSMRLRRRHRARAPNVDWPAQSPNYAHCNTMCVIGHSQDQNNWPFSKNYAQRNTLCVVFGMGHLKRSTLPLVLFSLNQSCRAVVWSTDKLGSIPPNLAAILAALLLVRPQVAKYSPGRVRPVFSHS